MASIYYYSTNNIIESGYDGNHYDLENIVDYYGSRLWDEDIYIESGNINNGRNNFEINGDYDSGHIINSGSYGEIRASRGNDYISNSGSYVHIDGDAGNDTITNTGNHVNIRAKEDNDVITNEGSDVYIQGESGNDNIVNNGNDFWITGGNGNDYIYNTASHGEIYGDVVGYSTIEGANTIVNLGNDVAINGGGGKDTITNSGSDVTISGGEGNDSITNSGARVTITGGNGDNTITNSGSHVTINGDIGSVNITNTGDDVTILSSYDKNIINSGNNVSIEDAGNTTLVNEGSNVTIEVPGDDSTITTSGENNTIVIKRNTRDNLIKLGDKPETIKIDVAARYSGNYTSFRIENFNEGDVIEFDEFEYTGNKEITSVETVDGGSIIDGVKIEGVTVAVEEDIKWQLDEATHVATYGGKTTGGNAVLSADRKSIVYKETTDRSGTLIKLGGIASTVGMEPNDKIVNLSPENFVASGATVQSNTFNYTFALDGDFGNKTFTADKEDDTISVHGSNVTVKSGSGNDSIYNNGLNNSIDSGDNNDTIDNRGAGVTINSGVGDDSIYNAMEASETTILSGADKDTIFNVGSSVSIDSGTEDDVIENTGNEVTISGGSGDDSIVNHDGDNVSINGGDGKNTINNGGKDNVEVYHSGGSDVTIVAGKDEDSITNSGSKASIIAGGGKNTINNGVYYEKAIYGFDSTIQADDGDDVINNIATHASINAGDGKNTVTNGFYDTSFDNILKWVIEGQDDFVDYIMNLTNNTSSLVKGGEDATVISGKGDDLIVNRGSYASIVSDAGADRIFSTDGENNIINAEDGNDKIIVHHDIGSLILGGSGNDEIMLSRFGPKDYCDATKFVAGLIGDNIVSQVKGHIKNFLLNTTAAATLSKNPYVTAGWAALSLGWEIGTFFNEIKDFFKTREQLIEEFSSVSNIIGGIGDDTVICDGLANRTYHYSLGDGNDVIEGFSNATFAEYLSTILVTNLPLSTLHIESGNIESVTVNGSDVIFNIGAGSITLIDAANQKFNLQEANGTLTTRAYGKDEESGELICSIFGSNSNDVIKDTINPENTRYCLYGDDTHSGGVTGADSLVGNDKDDTLYGGSAEAYSEKDTLRGGKGNDILYGGNKSLLDGGEGNDVIYSGRMISYPLPTGDLPGYGNNNTIYGGAGNDIIYNYGGNTFIDAGTDNDQIFNYGIDTRLEGVHYANGGTVTIHGGAGNDLIENSTTKVTINGGANDDRINLLTGSDNTLIEYNSGDGHDVVEGFNSSSTLRIGNGSGTYSTSTEGNNIVVTVGTGSITLLNAALLSGTINIEGQYVDHNNTQPDTTPPDTTPPDTTPPDTTPADTTPPDTTPADTTPPDTTPPDTTPADTTPADTTPPDTTPPDTTQPDTTQPDTTQPNTTPPDTTPSSQEQSEPVKILENTTGISIQRLHTVVVTNPQSIGTAIANRSNLLDISSSKGVMNVDLRGSLYIQAVSLEGGNQNVHFNDENGNVAITGADSSGSKNIIFGNGTDVGIFTGKNANTQVSVGAGDDSIITDNDARVRVDLADSGATRIIPYSGKVTLTNYDASTGAAIQTNSDDITKAIKENSIQLRNSQIRFGSTTVSLDSPVINLVASDDSIQKVGFIDGGQLITQNLRGDFLLKANYAESSSASQANRGSSISAGDGNDTILAGSRDFVDAGNGRNQVFLTPYDLRKYKEGATIAIGSNSRTTVHGFHEGLSYDGDLVQIDNLNDLKFKFQRDGLLLTSGNARLKLDGIGTTASAADSAVTTTSIIGTDKPELIQLTDGTSTVKAAFVQSDQSVLVQKDNYVTPNAFFGNRSGLNFSAYTENMSINLATGTGSLGHSDATFSGINKLQAGDGLTTLIGDSERNTLVAGNGHNSLTGGAGNDFLVGRADSSDKNGKTTFFFLAGDDHDTISNFNFTTAQNRYSGLDDRINITSANAVTNAFVNRGNVVLQINDSDDYLTIKDAVGKDFRINNLIAKVDRNISYDGIANCYVASGGSSLTVDSSVGSAEIWLDNSHGQYFLGNIRTLDASAVEGRTSLVGNSFDNTIRAGHDDASLWGGSSDSDDLLVGGGGRNTFFYLIGNGNDTITGVNDGDRVVLSNVFLDQILSTNISSDSVSINFVDGGTLKVNGNSNVTYLLADNSRYSPNHDRLEWNSR